MGMGRLVIFGTAFAAVASVGISPCAVAAPTPAEVRVIVDPATRKLCHYLGLVSVRKAMGSNKSGGALKKAMRAVADLGGNGLYLINQSHNWVDGASVTGEALACPPGTESI
jgi:hypothetical protein